MCNAPAEFHFPKYEANRIATNVLQKCLIKDKTDEVIVNEITGGSTSIYQQTKHGQSALFLALAKNREAIVKKLLEIYEADLSVLKAAGWSKDAAVLVAFGAKDVELIEKKLSAPQAGIEGPNKVIVLIKETNESPAKALPLSSEDRKLYLEIVERLHPNGTFDLDIKDANGNTLFMVATALGNIPVMEKLIEIGVRTEEVNNLKLSPFAQACNSNQLESVKWLHKKFHLDLLKLMMDGPTLFSIADRGSFEVFNYILNEIMKSEGDDQIQAVFDRKNEYYENNVLLEALHYGKPGFVKECLRFEPNLHHVNASRHNILHSVLTAYPVDRDLFKLLMKKEPKLVVGEDSNQWTPLHHMATQNFLEELKEIYEKFPFYKNTFFKHFADTPTLEKRADNVWCPGPGHEAFTQLAIVNHVEMAEFILKNHPESFENSAYLSVLIGNCSLKILESLKKLKHFNVNSPNTYGSYPLADALRNRKFEQFNYLLKNCEIKDLNDMKDGSMKQNLLFHAISGNFPDVPGRPYRNCCLKREVDSSDEERDDVEMIQCFTGAEGLVGGNDEDDDDESKNEKEVMLAIFKDLIQRGVDVKARDSLGKSLLHLAVEKNNLEVVEELMKHKLELDIVDEFGNTPLHSVRSVEVFKALLGDEIKPELVNKKNNEGRSPFFNFVTLYGYVDPPLELFQAFIEQKADVNTSDNELYRPIHAIFTESWVKLLIEHGADVTVTNSAGENAVHIALRNHKPQLAKYLLLNTEIDRFALTNEEVSYLGHLMVGNKTDFGVFGEKLQPMMEKQIEKFINGKTSYGGLITHALVTSGNFKLLQHPNADLHKKEADGQTCLHKAIHVDGDKLKMTKFLLEKGLDENATTDNGFTPLHFAVDYHHSDVACLLIEQENIDVNAVNAYGYTALHYAARNELVKVVCKLLAAGADISISNNDNETFYDLLNEFYRKVFRCFVEKL